MRRFDVCSNWSVLMKRTDCGRCRMLLCYISPAEKIRRVDGEERVRNHPAISNWGPFAGRSRWLGQLAREGLC